MATDDISAVKVICANKEYKLFQKFSSLCWYPSNLFRNISVKKLQSSWQQLPKYEPVSDGLKLNSCNGDF